ncbi:MAG: hypothetical protein V2A58_12205 [Planctomycetota bacterium]
MSDHSFMTRLAFEALPPAARACWKDQEPQIIDRYSLYPDLYWDPSAHEEVRPHVLLIDGRPFHYAPSNELEYNNWEMVPRDGRYAIARIREGPNRNWQFVREGFLHYLDRSARLLSGGNLSDAAKALGVLVHFLEEAHVLHALEGPDGLDFFALDRLVAPPEGEPHRSPTAVLTEMASSEGDIRPYSTRLLGTSVGEVAFRLYSEHHRLMQQNRFLHLPLLSAILADERGEALRHLRRMNENIARLVCDAVFTVTSMATGAYDDADLAGLQHLSLEDLHPVSRPCIAGGPYRFTPFVKGACLSADRRCVPLAVRLLDGSVRSFARGWGSGTHIEAVLAYDLPPQVYEALEVTVGLHEPLGRDGRVRLRVELDDRPLVDGVLSRENPAIPCCLPVVAGGYLRLITRSLLEDWTAPENNLVWGDPRLVRSPQAPAWRP